MRQLRRGEPDFAVLPEHWRDFKVGAKSTERLELVPQRLVWSRVCNFLPSYPP
jgi:hypothetical protein